MKAASRKPFSNRNIKALRESGATEFLVVKADLFSVRLYAKNGTFVTAKLGAIACRFRPGEYVSTTIESSLIRVIKPATPESIALAESIVEIRGKNETM